MACYCRWTLTEICSLTGAPNHWIVLVSGRDWKSQRGEGTPDLTKKLTAENLMVVMMGVTAIWYRCQGENMKPYVFLSICYSCEQQTHELCANKLNYFYSPTRYSLFIYLSGWSSCIENKNEYLQMSRNGFYFFRTKARIIWVQSMKELYCTNPTSHETSVCQKKITVLPLPKMNTGWKKEIDF